MRRFRIWIIPLVLGGCAYRLVFGPLEPLPSTSQAPFMTVLDDGTVIYSKARLEIGLRPMTDEELNRQFPTASKGGVFSTNPYTYGDWKPPGEERPPSRFTVFLLSVKNYAYPKIKLDPLKMTIVAKNGRKYRSLSMQELKEYYLRYAVGYSGDAYARYEARKDILKHTMFSDEPIFSGQERKGYVVFPKLHDDVREITVRIDDIVLRFDAWGRPIEEMSLAFNFKREVLKRE